MPAYIVTLNREKGGKTLTEGADAMVVFATDATEAKEICAAKYQGEGDLWTSANSTVTEIVQDADWDGWTFKFDILDGFGVGADEPVSFSLTGDATDNTIDEIGAALVTLFNAHADIANAAYNSTSQVLDVTGVADGFGDQTLVVTITPPGGFSGIPSQVGTIVHEGIAGAVLSVELPADAAVIPIVAAPVIQV